jgi:hypothetical protein
VGHQHKRALLFDWFKRPIEQLNRWFV